MNVPFTNDRRNYPPASNSKIGKNIVMQSVPDFVSTQLALSSLRAIKLKIHTGLPYPECLFGITFQVQKSSSTLLQIIENQFLHNIMSSLGSI